MVTVEVKATLPVDGFWVDGQFYQGSMKFTWEAGSKHLLELRTKFVCLSESKRARLGWSWTANTGLVTDQGPVQIVTVDPAVTTFIAAASAVEYRVNLWMNSGPMPAGFMESQVVASYAPNGCEIEPAETVPPRPDSQYGYLLVQGASLPVATTSESCASGGAVTKSTWFWSSPGALLTLSAFPYPGKVFRGYYMPPASGSSYLNQIVINGPTNIYAQFGDGRRVSLDSAPVSGLKVTLDGYKVPTRSDKCLANLAPPTSIPQSSLCVQVPLCDGEFDVVPDTRHTLGAPASQTDSQNRTWVFDHWELEDQQTGGQNTVFSIPSGRWTPAVYKAVFVKGLRVNFVTAPAGLKLKLDGRDDWASYNFDWGTGHKHTVSAPLEQVDSRGRKYRFQGWSNAGPAEQEIVVAEAPDSPGGMRLIARYELLGQLKLNSEPPGLTLKAGDVECRTPCTIDEPAGTEISIDPGAEHVLAPGTKAAFVNWMDGAPSGVRLYRFPQDAAALWAGYRILHKLDVSAAPEGGATWKLDPAPEAGGYYNAGSAIQVLAEPNPGFRFRLWDGALVSSQPSGWLVVNRPSEAVVRLDRTRALREDAVRNAAGETPQAAVAPGSLISIQGYHLAEAAEQGPANPLVTVLKELTVSVMGNSLPLVSVSPDEIIAQLPAALKPGDHVLVVSSPGQAPVEAQFTVAPNAPGLFRERGAPAETPLAMALHEDGRPILPEDPAQVGETVLLLGTGFGLAEPQPQDGVAAPVEPPAPLKDGLELLVGGEVRPHAWAGAAPGMVGYSLVKVKIDATMGQAQNLDVRVRVNGRESNAVLLPVQ